MSGGGIVMVPLPVPVGRRKVYLQQTSSVPYNRATTTAHTLFIPTVDSKVRPMPRAYMERKSFTSLPSTSADIVEQHQKRWKCMVCKKSLSSKRSYQEHVNTHTKSKPFKCPDCEYAAASQMTLRRHRLRNHVPRQKWGYRCPYCPDSFMEPASYQQHVCSRHFGRSCTLGCPIPLCTFMTKCARHFKEHMEKHMVTRINPYTTDFENLNEGNLQKYLVDDEYGVGYGREPLISLRRTLDSSSVKLESKINDVDIMKEPLRIPVKPPPKAEQLYPTRPINASKPDILPADSEWIETEIEVVSCDTDKLYHKGLEDFELD